MTLTRVATYVSRQTLVGRMTDLQARLHETEIQVASEKKSQTYSGISTDAFRLINFENQRDRYDRYVSANKVAEVRLKSMDAAVTASRDSVLDFRRKVIELSQQGLSANNVESVRALDELQKRAFSAMQDMQHYLNTNADGRYVFAGGKTDTPPVTLPWSSLSEFQDAYDGNTIKHPTTQAANLFDVTITDMDITATNEDTSSPADGTADHGLMTAAAGKSFITRTLDSTQMGTVTLDATSSTLRATTAGTFTSFTRGSTLLLEDGTAAAGNQQAYTITDISADGRQLTVTPPPAADDTLASAELHMTIPNGTKISVGGAAGIAGTYTVDWPTPWPAVGATDGTQLFVKPTLTAGAYDPVSVETQSYYQGDDLETQHRVDDHRSIDFGINAKNAAFEKAIRAMGQIAQGAPTTDGNPLESDGSNFDATAMDSRIKEALTLLNDALDHRPTTPEDPSDIDSVSRQIANSHRLLSTVNNQHADTVAYLEARMSDMENVNMVEAVTRLQDDARALEISYQTTSRVMKLSLHNYI